MLSGRNPQHLQIKFFTKEQKYAVPSTPFSVPSTVGVEELNSLIKSLLTENKEDCVSVEFDFLIGNEFLRIPLYQHLEQKDITSESVIEIEYVQKYPAPSPENCFLHDDWVSAIHASKNWILTGCYDHSLHIWSFDGEHKLTIPGHMGPIKAVKWLDTSASSPNTFISTSHDQTAMIWEWNPEQNSVDCVYACRGHARSVDCVAASQTGDRFVTGSWDRMLKLWSAQLEDATDDDDRKRLKTESGTGSKNRTPIMTLSGHKEAVSAVQWSGKNEVCSASWDHTIRVWDVEIGGMKTQLIGTKSFLDISYSELNSHIISASSDRHVRLWDPKVGDGSIVQMVFTSHTGWVTSVHWSPDMEHQFISGSHDMIMKFWDIRSPKSPLYDMTGHEDKILCCDWSNKEYMLSGGADNYLRLFKCT